MPPLQLHMMRDLYESRESFIEDVANVHCLDRDEARWPGYRKELVKALLLRIMYGGSYDSWMEDNGIYGQKSRRIIRLQVELERFVMSYCLLKSSPKSLVMRHARSIRNRSMPRS